MKIERKPYQNNTPNPFVKTRNPFHIAQKLYTSPSQSRQNILKGYFSHNPYNNECNHCQQNVSIYKDLQQISFLLKNEKQNLQKMSSINHKNKKIQNPFARSILFQQNISPNNEQAYTRKDQSMLKNLIYNNPFKEQNQKHKSIQKQVQKSEEPVEPYLKKTLNHSKSMQITIHQINLKQPINTYHLKTPQSVSIRNSASQRGSVCLSIESVSRPVNQLNKFSSGQNSPTKIKSMLSPTMNDIVSCRNSKQKINIQLITQGSNLIKQISQSRKSIQPNRNSVQEYKISQIPKDLQAQQILQVTKVKQIQKILIIKGKQFYLNTVELIRWQY